MSDNKEYQSPWHDNKRSTNNDYSNFFQKNGLPFNNMDFKPTTIAALVFIIALLLWLLSGFYIVDEGERAAVTRFGKYIKTTSPGPNYHLPYPIENIIKVQVDRVQKEEIGFRSTSSTTNQTPKMLAEESLMLTGDENIADINFFVQWRVDNIKDYLYNVEHIKATVKRAAESAMREVVGNTTITQAQTDGRAQVEHDAQELLQKILDGYNAGVRIETLRLLKVDPPQEVIDAFRDVQTARADKERRINQAESVRNDVLPRARGEASQITQDAEGYKKQVIAQAQGNARKFKDIHAQYAQAKDITKSRMYIETMEQILTDIDKMIVSENIGKSAVPYLPLNQLKKSE